MKNYAYKGTTVNWVRSQTAIVKMLTTREIYESRFTNLEDRFALEFRVVEAGVTKPLAIRIVVPFQHKGELDSKNREKELNQMHRILFHHLKAKFLAVDSGLTEFMEEFMPHLIVADNKGNSTTLGQIMLPQYKKNEKQYPCFTSVDKTKWCGGGSRAIENLLDKLNKGEWAVDFIPILTSQ